MFAHLMATIYPFAYQYLLELVTDNLTEKHVVVDKACLKMMMNHIIHLQIKISDCSTLIGPKKTSLIEIGTLTMQNV